MKTDTRHDTLHWRSITSHFMPFVRRYVWLNMGMFLAYGITALIGSVAFPLLYKEFVDIVAAGDVLAGDAVWVVLLWLVVATIVHRAAHTLGDLWVKGTF